MYGYKKVLLILLKILHIIVKK